MNLDDKISDKICDKISAKASVLKTKESDIRVKRLSFISCLLRPESR